MASERYASTCTKYGAYKVKPNGLELMWSSAVDDNSGLASTTAFDFLGGGIAQAVYGDQKALYVFDGSNGKKLFDSPLGAGEASPFWATGSFGSWARICS